MFVFESKDPMFFYKATNSKPYFFSEDAEVMGKENFFTIESFYDICSYIKLNSSKSSSYIFPPYTKNFRYLASRQGFVGEKNDGNYAGLNRRFASRYYSQIEALTGMEYHQLSEPMYEGGINYKSLRDGYLSLSKQDIRKIQGNNIDININLIYII